MTDLTKKKGTIAYVLTKHQDEIYALINKNDIQGAKKLCIELLDSQELAKNNATEKAKKILSMKNGNQFLTVLVTYMYGMKAN